VIGHQTDVAPFFLSLKTHKDSRFKEAMLSPIKYQPIFEEKQRVSGHCINWSGAELCSFIQRIRTAEYQFLNSGFI